MNKTQSIGAGALALMVMACSSDGSADTPPPPAASAKPAVVVAVGVRTPEGRQMYIGAYASMPSGDLDLGRMLELPYSYVKIFGERVFAYDAESATMRRYRVDDDLRLVDDGRLSFASAGVTYVDLQIRDDRLAYGVSSDLVIEWNPTTLEIVRTYPSSLGKLGDLPPNPDSLSLVGGPLFAGAAHWNVYANDSEALRYHDAAVVAFLEPGATVFQTIEDTRCAPNGKSYVVGGDLYLIGANTSAQAIKVYNTAYASAAPNCVLRVRAGERRFDPDYFVDLNKATGSPAIFGTWKVDDGHLVAQVWDPADAFPAAPGDYWTSSSFVTKLVKLVKQTGEAELFPGVAKGRTANDRELVLDGQAYFQVADADGGSVTMSELRTTGLAPVFRSRGTVYAMGRVR